MVLQILIFLAPLLIRTPEVSVDWLGPDQKEVAVRVKGDDELMAQCVESGLEARYLYEIDLCRPRTLWFDRCEPRIEAVHAVVKDPIGDSYTARVDQIGDGLDPVVSTVTSLGEAMAICASVPKLGVTESETGRSDDAYISVRVRSDCKGGYNRTLARIGYFLSFGLVEVSGFNTGRIEFHLKR